MALVSLLPVPSGDTEADNLAAAEAAVRAYCGWHIAPVITEELVIDGNGAASLPIPSLRVVDITAASDAGRVLDPATLEWSRAGFLRSAGRWTSKLRGVRLTVKHGFDSAPDVAQIVRDIAGRGGGPAGVVREQAGQVSIGYSQVAPGVSGGVVLMDHERAMLDRYRVAGRS